LFFIILMLTTFLFSYISYKYFKLVTLIENIDNSYDILNSLLKDRQKILLDMFNNIKSSKLSNDAKLLLFELNKVKDIDFIDIEAENKISELLNKGNFLEFLEKIIEDSDSVNKTEKLKSLIDLLLNVESKNKESREVYNNLIRDYRKNINDFSGRLISKQFSTLFKSYEYFDNY